MRTGFLRDLDPVRDAMGFHAAGRVDRVAPQIVNEFVSSDNSRDDGAGVDPDPNLDLCVIFLVEPVDFLLHVQRHFGNRFGVARTGNR